jgi:hypothetical protein
VRWMQRSSRGSVQGEGTGVSMLGAKQQQYHTESSSLPPLIILFHRRCSNNGSIVLTSPSTRSHTRNPAE